MSWNRPSSGEAKFLPLQGKCGRSSYFKGKGFLISLGVVVVIVAAVVAWFILSGDKDITEHVAEHKAQGTISEVKSAVSTPSSLLDEAKEKSTADAEAATNEVDGGKKPGVFAPGMIRLPNGLELRFKLPSDGETRQVLAGGKIWEIDSKGNIEDITPPPIFEKPFEGMLSALFERDGLVLPFQLKQFSEKEIRKMCKEPTLSYEDDTPEITAKRENVVMLKKAVLEFLDGGGKFEEFVDDMAKHSQDASIAQVTGVRDIHDLLANGKNHEALQYYKVFSEEMAEKGYGELRLPRAFKEALEEQRKMEEVKQ